MIRLVASLAAAAGITVAAGAVVVDQFDNAPAVAQSVCPQADASGVAHWVAKSGDSFTKIATACNTTLSALLVSDNKTMAQANALKVGQVVHVVPGAPPTTTTTTTVAPATTTTTRPPTTTSTTTTLPPTTTTTTTTTVPSGTIPDIPSTDFNRESWLVQGIVPRPSVGAGNFRMFCGFAKIGYYDPIVYPGQISAGHLHQFFGNDAVTGQSTYQTLRTSGGGTCQGGPLNRTGYWAPAMFNPQNQVVVPSTFSVYYKAQGSPAEIAAVRTNPNGLRMIAGYDMANQNTSMPLGMMRVDWTCNGRSASNLTGFTSTNCPSGAELKAGLRFPMCWDGVNIDSANHRSHMAYGIGGGGWFTGGPNGGCPTTHPIHLPEFTLFVHYKSDGNVANWYLSSDRMPGMTHLNGETFHADWFGAWDPQIQETWTQECIREMRDCNFGELGDGTQLRNYSGTYPGPDRIPGYTPTAP